MYALLIRSFIFSSAVVGVLTATGCSSSSGSSPAPASPTTPTTTTTSGTLSAAFATNCASCHGKDGSTKFGSKALKGSTAFTTTSWKAAVRNGQGTMPSFETADYSDVDMKADYKVLTSKTWQ